MFEESSRAGNSNEESLVEKEIEQEIKEYENAQEQTCSTLANDTQETQVTLDNTIVNSSSSDELYSTANSMIIPCTVDPEETSMPDEGDLVLFKNCQVAFMTSPKNVFIQLSDYYEQLARIQPIIDDCLDSFDLSKSNLCIAQSPEDELFYRCRIRSWNEAANTADVTFIDFGDNVTVSIDTVTAMEASLFKVKPLVVRCRFRDAMNVGSKAWKNFERLVVEETKWNVSVNKDELAKYYESMEVECAPVVFRVFSADGRDLEANEATLEEGKLWEADRLMSESEIKQVIDDR